MSIVTSVDRSLGKAVRATHAETGSPYFAPAVLKHRGNGGHPAFGQH